MKSRALTALTVLAGILAVGEFISALIIWRENYADSAPVFAAVFGVLFILGILLLRSGRVTAAAIYLVVLCLFEVVSYPGWARHNALDWGFQTAYAVLALGGLIAAVAVIIGRRRASAAIR